MKKQPTSTMFKFVLSTQETLKNLDELKLSNYERFVKTSQTGKKIQDLAKADMHVHFLFQPKVELDQLCTKHMFDIPFLKLEIEDAFVSSFNLRNFEVSRYFLENGLQLNDHMEDAVVSLAYSLEYLLDPKEAPLELLELAYFFVLQSLQYGANPRFCESMESNTGLHLAAQAGNLQFVKLLVEYGADINAVRRSIIFQVNDNKETPLGLAKKHKKNMVAEYLKSINANEFWNE